MLKQLKQLGTILKKNVKKPSTGDVEETSTSAAQVDPQPVTPEEHEEIKKKYKELLEFFKNNENVISKNEIEYFKTKGKILTCPFSNELFRVPVLTKSESDLKYYEESALLETLTTEQIEKHNNGKEKYYMKDPTVLQLLKQYFNQIETLHKQLIEKNGGKRRRKTRRKSKKTRRTRRRRRHTRKR
jgi:hypothetical protein